MILVLDNYDSFTYNLVQYLGICGAETVVLRNDAVTLEEIVAMKPDGILLSPGPCTPDRSGVCIDVVGAALQRELAIPLFGVCLGHQAIGLVSGGVVRRAEHVRHGKPSPVSHDGQGVFAQMPNPFSAIRYHSLVIDPSSLSPDFVVTARSDDDGEIMGVRHKSLPIEGVQFHPESVLTENGLQIIRNFVEMVQPVNA